MTGPLAPTLPLEEHQRYQPVQIRYVALQQQELKESVQRPTWKKGISFILRVGVTLLLFAFLFKSVSWSTLWTVLVHVDHRQMLVGLMVGIVGLLVSSFQWQSLLRAEQINVGLFRLIQLYLVGIAFSHFLPTGMGGDAVKALYVGRESGNGAGSVSAVVMSRITGFFGMLLLALPVLFIWFPHFTPTIRLWFALLSLLVGSMIGGAICSTMLVSRISTGRWVKNHIFASVTRIGNAIRMSVRRPRSLCMATIFGVLFWITGCLNYYSYGIALHMNVPLYFYFVAIPFVSLLTFLPISINGFGVRESAFVYIFSTIHVPLVTSLLLAFLMDAQVLFFGAIGGYMYLTMSNKTKAMKQSAYREGMRSMMSEYDQHDTRVPHLDTDLSFTEEPTQPMKAIRPRPASQVAVSEPEVKPQEEFISPRIAPPINTLHDTSTTFGPPSRKKKRKKTWIVLISSVIGLLALAGAIASAYVFYETTQTVPNVTLYQVGTQQNVSQFVGGGGIVFPYQQMDISYPDPELVTAVLVKVGDQVSINQPLVQLNDTLLKADIAQAANDLAAAAVYLNEVTATGNPVTIAQAQQAYNVAKDKYDTLVATATSPILHNDTLISPINGVVTSVNVNPGDTFAGNTPLLTVMDESKVIVHVKVPLSNLRQVHPGLTAVVTPSALPNLNFSGTVSTIVPQADPQTDTFEVWIVVSNSEKELLPGMSTFVRIQYQGKALVVPRLAVLNPDNDSVVFVVRQQHAYIQHVHVIGRSIDSIYIDAGISPGDMIVLVGADKLRDGQEVHVTHREGPTA